MGEETSDRDESQEVEEHRDDLELPDETAEEVTGGVPAWKRPDKQNSSKI